jgi:hypothetical protein
MSCNTITFKRGSSFSASMVWNPEPGGIANLVGVTVTSSIIDTQQNEYDLTCTVAAGGLSVTMVYPGSTADWALGSAKWDIKFLDGGTVFYSETMRIDLIGQVTA